MNRPLSPNDVDRVVTEIVERRTVRIDDIIRVVAEHFEVTKQDLLSARRTANVVLPRQIAMYFAKTMTLRSLPEIGRRFGGRDHTTVLHAVRKIEKLVCGDREFADTIAALRSRIGGAAMSETAWPWNDLKPAHYRVIYVDLPTPWAGGTKGRPQHYKRMSVDDILAPADPPSRPSGGRPHPVLDHGTARPPSPARAGVRHAGVGAPRLPAALLDQGAVAEDLGEGRRPAAVRLSRQLGQGHRARLRRQP